MAQSSRRKRALAPAIVLTISASLTGALGGCGELGASQCDCPPDPSPYAGGSGGAADPGTAGGAGVAGAGGAIAGTGYAGYAGSSENGTDACGPDHVMPQHGDGPPPCPASEPDPEACVCAWTMYTGGARCSYPRSTCKVYLDCAAGSTETGGVGPGQWIAGGANYERPDERAADDCCPTVEPAIGDPCAEENVLCDWGRKPFAPSKAPGPRQLLCRSGAWIERPSAPHASGGSGTGGSAGLGAGSDGS